MGRILTTIYVLYLILGNLPRFGNVFKLGGFPVTELLLYGAGLVFFFALLAKGSFDAHYLRILSALGVISFIFLASWDIGVMFHGVELSWSEIMLALAYSLRLIGIGIVSISLGYLFFKTMPPGLIKIFFLRIAFAQMFLAIIIYVLFPHAEDLWAYLSQYGIVFKGDPHIRRLIGPMLDPNYFGNMLVYPILMSISKIIKTRISIPQVLVTIIFLVGIILTVSRSSLLGLGVGILVLLWEGRKRLNKVAIAGGILIAGVLMLSLIDPGLINRFIERFLTLPTDLSAFHRFASFSDGIRYISQYPNYIFGIGYNLIPAIAKDAAIVTAYDSSLINLFLSLGLPLGILTVIILIIFFAKSIRSIKNVDPILGMALSAWLWASIVMSFFNNLLFYPFYLLEIMPLLFYGGFLRTGRHVAKK